MIQACDFGRQGLARLNCGKLEFRARGTAIWFRHLTGFREIQRTFDLIADRLDAAPQRTSLK